MKNMRQLWIIEAHLGFLNIIKSVAGFRHGICFMHIKFQNLFNVPCLLLYFNAII